MTATGTAGPSELLDLLDRGARRSAPERAALLAEATNASVDAATLPLGVRDGLILELRNRLFGPALEAYDICPRCGEGMTFDVDVTELVEAGAAVPDAVIAVRSGGYDVSCRVPNSADMALAAEATGTGAATELVLSRIVLTSTGPDGPVPAAELPVEVRSEIAARLADSDPLAELSFTLVCQACGGGWRTVFDPGDFVWAELREFGRRLLREIHVLAGAYGWPEHDILALSPERRQTYLAMVLDG